MLYKIALLAKWTTHFLLQTVHVTSSDRYSLSVRWRFHFPSPFGEGARRANEVRGARGEAINKVIDSFQWLKDITNQSSLVNT
ncbi:MAG: hypothetical protein ICV84_15250 [Flavisolibacter sp.]|nr:hypothetical protein [Flavisolibacter sp.]